MRKGRVRIPPLSRLRMDLDGVWGGVDALNRQRDFAVWEKAMGQALVGVKFDLVGVPANGHIVMSKPRDIVDHAVVSELGYVERKASRGGPESPGWPRLGG